MSRIHVTINQAEIARMQAPGGSLYMAMDIAGRAVRDLAVEEITNLQASDSGKMRQALTWEVVRSAIGVTAHVGVDIAKTPGDFDYPLVVHQGRGPVRPRRARVLRFQPRGGGAFIFRPRVGAAKAKPFLTNALERFQFR